MSETVNQAMASRAMRGRTQEHVIRRRDAAGGEMEILAKVMNDPSPDPKEVQDYIVNLLRKGHISAQEAGELLASMPRDPGALRRWARVMFSAVMHEGIHAEAAFPRELYPSPQQAPDSASAPAAGNAANQPPQGP
jgi:hypothetical protein